MLAPVVTSLNIGNGGTEVADGTAGNPPSVPLLPTPTRRAELAPYMPESALDG